MRRLRRDGLAVAACDVLVDELRRAVHDLADEAVIAVTLDVSDEQSWRSALDQVVHHFGGLNVLVNNAGVLHRTPLVDESVTGFERLWR